MNTKEFERLVKMARLGEAVLKLATDGTPKRGRPFGSTKQAANGEAKPKRKRTRKKNALVGDEQLISDAALADHVE